MHFIAVCRDKPGNLPVRLANRDAHVAWLRGLGTTIRIAGPILDETGAEMRGSLLVVEAESLEAARTLLDADPYRAAGLFDSVTVEPWRWTIGAPA